MCPQTQMYLLTESSSISFNFPKRIFYFSMQLDNPAYENNYNITAITPWINI